MSYTRLEEEVESIGEPESGFAEHVRTVLQMLGVASVGLVARGAIDVHDVVSRGLPQSSLKMLQAATGLSPAVLAPAVRISARSYQRLMASSKNEALPVPLSSDLWQFADIYARAVEVMGSNELATQWLNTEALALDGRKPIDLLSTLQGADMVSDLLTRLDYGVYT